MAKSNDLCFVEYYDEGDRRVQIVGMTRNGKEFVHSLEEYDLEWGSIGDFFKLMAGKDLTFSFGAIG